jgi:hypothetical protein
MASTRDQDGEVIVRQTLAGRAFCDKLLRKKTYREEQNGNYVNYHPPFRQE